jgi:hypothetical protein
LRSAGSMRGRPRGRVSGFSVLMGIIVALINPGVYPGRRAQSRCNGLGVRGYLGRG